MSSEKCIQPQGHQDSLEEHTLSSEIFHLMKHENRKWAFLSRAAFCLCTPYTGAALQLRCGPCCPRSVVLFMYVVQLAFVLRYVFEAARFSAFPCLSLALCVPCSSHAQDSCGLLAEVLRGRLAASSGSSAVQNSGRAPPTHADPTPLLSAVGIDRRGEAIAEDRGVKRKKRR